MKRIYHCPDGTFLASPHAPANAVEVRPQDLPRGAVITVGLGRSEILPSADFETYSEAGYAFQPTPETAHKQKWQPPYKVIGIGSQGKGGLPVVGTPVYVEHPTAEVLSFAYNLKDGLGKRLWLPYPGMPEPLDLFNYVRSGGLLEAHNAAFEWYVWNVICVPKHGWPFLPLDQLRCSAAKARRYSLPSGLENCSQVLQLAGKDKRGTQLIQKLTRPHTPTKTRPEHRWTPESVPEDFNAFYQYNLGDTDAEDDISARIPDLTEQELKVWQITETINARGLRVDQPLLQAALAHHRDASIKYNAELYALTGGAVETVNQNKKFIAWVQSRGVQTNSLDEEHRAALLEAPDTPREVRRAMEIADMIMSANIKKLYTLDRQTSRDGRLRGQYTYCGADRTGRFSAGGVQLQNMTAKGPPTAKCEGCDLTFGYDDSRLWCPRCGCREFHVIKDWNIAAMEQGITDIHANSFEKLTEIWPAPVDLLCGCLRGMFIAAEGKRFLCCDFSAIEAVVLARLARCQWRIDVFNTPGECIYTQSAAKITGKPIGFYKEYKARTDQHHEDRKKIGKIAELASGYGGWIGAWKNFGADKYFSDAEIKKHVLSWRAESPEIEALWGGQFRWCGPGKWDYEPCLHGLEGMAIKAIMYPGQCFSYIDITYGVFDDILYCRLPSGRFLHYHKPRLAPAEDKLNRGPAVKITFEGWNSNPQKGPLGWHRWDTYGGRLAENVTQAVAADIQTEAMVRCEEAGYPIVLHTHDEICAEVEYGRGSIDEMVRIMTTRPSWASWWPINAAGWEHERYQKD